MDDAVSRSARTPLLVPGETCWRIEHARRFAVLVDGEPYFTAVREALVAAQRSILVLGWDVDSRFELVPGGAKDGWPDPLGAFLDAIVAARPALEAYILSWDYALLFALEREHFPQYKLERSTHERMHFRLDGVHPTGASHHQKIIVVDDAVAFCGGFDLTKCRWDTTAHRRDEPRRVEPSGRPYAPFHDVGAVVDGDAARALGELARLRWRDATGETLAPPAARDGDLWPASVAPELGPVDVAIARTMPSRVERPQIEEIRALTLSAIARTTRTIFVEQQYFTSSVTAEALEARLREPDGPEVVLVMSREQCGWLEERTMGVLRARLDRRLRAADRHGRYRLFAACRRDDAEDCIHIHSKVLIVDDAFLSVGSANLSNRSMGLDTECNLAVDARGDADIAAAIRAVRARLVAEHLDGTPDEVERAIERAGSLSAAIDGFEPRARRLVRFEPELTPDRDALVPDGAVLDPERPLDPERLVAELVDDETAPSARRHVATIALVALVFALALVAWRYTPLRELVSVPRLVALAQEARDEAWVSLAALAAYVVGALVAFPITVLIVATGLVFGPWLGIALALVGTIANAALGYAIGARLGGATVRRLAGGRMQRLSRRLAERGLVAIAVVRIVPIAPFTVVNLVAGAARIGWRDYLVGTVVAMTPGIVLMVVFADRALAALRDPGPWTFAVLALLAALILASSWAIGGWLARRDRARPRVERRAVWS